MRTALGIALAIAVGAACAGRAAAQDTSTEVWPEVDVWVKLRPALKLFFPISVSRSRETKYTEGHVGAHVDYRFSRTSRRERATATSGRSPTSTPPTSSTASTARSAS